MIKLKGLTNEQVTEISLQVADAFYDYSYNAEDQGLIRFISNRDDMFIYMNTVRFRGHLITANMMMRKLV